jgi:hypothetical protein
MRLSVKLAFGLFFVVAASLIVVCTAQYPCADCSQNEIAAGGPVPGNFTVAFQEAKCTAEEKNAPWYPTLVGFERHDSNSTTSIIVRSSPGRYRS